MPPVIFLTSEPLTVIFCLQSMRCAWVMILALPGCLCGQTQPVPTITTTASEVLVDFVARDKHGQIVRDLRPEAPGEAVVVP